MKFKDLKIGDKFTCFGDIFINYNFPKICRCIKCNEYSGQEVDGVSFLVDPNDDVDLGWD